MRHSVMMVLGAAALAMAGCESQPKRPTVNPGIEAVEAQTARAIELFEQGERARLAGDTDQAMALYRQSIRVKGSMPEPWNQLGVLLMQQGELRDSADAFRNALAYSRPEDPRAAENLGLVYSKAGWGEESLRYYEQALDRDPHSRAALRGAIRAAHLLQVASEPALDRVMTGLMVESDPQWHEFYLREKFRIEQRLRLDDEG